MPHPNLGLPPHDTMAGAPAAAALLRREKKRLARVALESAVEHAPYFHERYDEAALRLLLRDLDQHIEQLARALETGRDSYVVEYGEWIVPVYRRRRMPMKDFVVLLGGIRDAAVGILPQDAAQLTRSLIDRWAERLKHHGRLAGDHKGNPIVRFLWKGAGIGDDSVV
jgi:hypothetical protein